MIVIGVTGGICQGKSAVMAFLEAEGYAVISGDKTAHQSYLPGTDCYNHLIEAFGSSIVGADGLVNRAVLGKIVFADRSQLDKLNSIVWPPTRDLIKSQVKNFEVSGCKVVFIEAAVLVEAGWTAECDQVWVVRCNPETQVLRLMSRNRISREEAVDRISALTSDEERVKAATHVIDNDGSLAELQGKVQALIQELNLGSPGHACTTEGSSVQVPPVVAPSPAETEPAEEVVWYVDEDNCVLGAVPRSRMRKEKLWHRATYIIVINAKGELYVQRRTMCKDYCPGYFDAATGGVVAAGEDTKDSAVRELGEELGIYGVPIKFLFDFKYQDDVTKVWGSCFLCHYDGPVTPQPSEVQEVVMMTLDDIAAREARGEYFTPDSQHCLTLYKRYVAANTPVIPKSVSSQAKATSSTSWLSSPHVWTVAGAVVAVAATVFMSKRFRG